MALTIADIAGVITLKDKFTPTVNNVVGSLGSFGPAAAVVGGAAAAVTALGSAVIMLGNRGAAVGDVARNFDGLAKSVNSSAQAMLGAMRQGTVGTIQDFELMKMANKALGAGFKGTAEDMGVLAAGARELAKRTGGDTAQAFDQLNSAMATGRAAGLANLGVFIDQKLAIDNFAASLGKSAGELNKSQRMAAVQAETLKALRGVLDQAGKQGADFGEQLSRMGIQVTNFVDRMSVAVNDSPALGVVLQAINDVIEQMIGWLEANTVAIESWLRGGVLFGIETLRTLVQIVGFVGDAIDAIIIVFYEAKAAAIAFAMGVLEGIKSLAQLAQQVPGSSIFEKLGLGPDIGSVINDLDSTLDGLSSSFDQAAAAAANQGKVNSEWGDTIAGVDAAIAKVGLAVTDTAGKVKAASGEIKTGVQEVTATYMDLREAEKKQEEEMKKILATMEKLGPTAKAVAQEWKDLATAVALQGGVSELTDKQLISLVQQLEDLARSGHDNEDVFKSLASAMQEAASRGDHVAASVGMVTKTTDGAATKTKEATKSTFDWAKALDQVRNTMQVLGISADSAFGKIVGGITSAMAGAQQLGSILKDADGNMKKTLTLNDKLAAGTAMLGAGMDIFQSGKSQGVGMGALGGAAKGAMMGAQFGPLGGLIGGAAGGLLGAAGGLFGGGEHKKVNDMRDAAFAAAGGFEELNKKAHAAGTTLDKVLKAKKVQDFDSAMKELNGTLALQGQANESLNEAINKYGFSIEQLGPKFQQQRMDEMAMGLVQDYRLLTASGIEHTLVVEKMGPALNEYVQTAASAGASIPEAMRPALEKMLEMGLLTDEAGNALTSLEGLTFAETLSESVSRVLEGIDKLVAAMLGVPNITRTITVVPSGEGMPTTPGTGGARGGHGAMSVPGLAMGGIVREPTLAMIGEAGPEAVIPLSEMGSMGGSVSLTIGPGAIVIKDVGDPQRTADLVAKALQDNLSGRLVTAMRERSGGVR